MIKNKTYKFRIYPTAEQEILLAKHFGCTRWVYNHFLNESKEQYQKNKKSDVEEDEIVGVVDLMGDAGAQQAEGGEFFPLDQLSLLGPFLGDVEDAHNIGLRGAGGVFNRIDHDLFESFRIHCATTVPTCLVS